MHRPATPTNTHFIPDIYGYIHWRTHSKHAYFTCAHAKRYGYRDESMILTWYVRPHPLEGWNGTNRRQGFLSLDENGLSGTQTHSLSQTNTYADIISWNDILFIPYWNLVVIWIGISHVRPIWWLLSAETMCEQVGISEILIKKKILPLVRGGKERETNRTNRHDWLLLDENV